MAPDTRQLLPILQEQGRLVSRAGGERRPADVELVQTFPAQVAASPVRDWLHGWFSSYRKHGGVISSRQEINYDDVQLATVSREITIVVFDRLVRIVDHRGFGDAAVDALALLSVIERVPYSVLALRHLEEEEEEEEEEEAVDASAFLVCRAILGIEGNRATAAAATGPTRG